MIETLTVVMLNCPMQLNKTLQGMRIGYVGLGNMGRPGSRHLYHAGAEVIVWNRSAGPAEAAVELGMRQAASLVELGQEVSDGIVCLNLTTTEVVEQVVFGPNGLKEGLGKNALIIDFGTTDVTATRRFAEQLMWLDAPVSGGQVGAESAELTIMAGGTAQAFERALPILQTVGKRITYMGQSGAGQVTKLANQLIVAQTIDAVAQALRLAELSGVDSSTVREALLGGFAESRILQVHGQRMVQRNFVPGGRAVLQLKDVHLICQLAQMVGFESSTLENCRRQWERLVYQAGLGELDHSGLFKLYETPEPG